MRVLKRALLMSLALALVTSTGLGQQADNPTESEKPTQAADETAGNMPVAGTTLNVVYEGGRLSIFAQRCTLKQILETVREKTGASLDLPAFLNFPDLVVQLGPDDPQRVLGSLLNGTGLNYILSGPAGEGQPLNVIVTLRSEPAIPTAPPAPAVAALPSGSAGQESADAGLDKAIDVAEKNDTNDPGAKEKKEKKESGKEEAAADKPAHVPEEAAAVASKSASPALEGASSSLADRLADLPSNIDPNLAGLYPGLFGGAGNGASSSSSLTPSAPGGSTAMLAAGAPMPQVSQIPVSSLPMSPNGVPILPNNIPPDMWKLYPPNLMQLVTTNTPPPPTPMLPVVQGMPTAGTTSQPVFWDQSLKGHP